MAEEKGPYKFGAKITKEEFKVYTDRFQQKHPEKIRSVIFDRETFERILSNKEVATISVFFGEDALGNNTVVLGGRDKNNELLEATLQNRGGFCPPYC